MRSFLLLFLLTLICSTQAWAQDDPRWVRRANIYSVVKVNDSTYQAEFRFASNELGTTFAPQDITAGWRAVDAQMKRYRVSTMGSSTLTSRTLTIVSIGGVFAAAPNPNMVVYEYTGTTETIPLLPVKTSQVNASWNARIHNYNLAVIGDGGGDGGGGGTVDRTRLIQDSILLYEVNGVEVGRDTLPVGSGGGGNPTDELQRLVLLNDTTLTIEGFADEIPINRGGGGGGGSSYSKRAALTGAGLAVHVEYSGSTAPTLADLAAGTYELTIPAGVIVHDISLRAAVATEAVSGSNLILQVVDPAGNVHGGAEAVYNLDTGDRITNYGQFGLSVGRTYANNTTTFSYRGVGAFTGFLIVQPL